MVKIAIVILVLLVLLYLLSPKMKEGFSNSVFETSLEKNMDYLKDAKGYTLNDYILSDNVVQGKPIESPYL